MKRKSNNISKIVMVLVLSLLVGCTNKPDANQKGEHQNHTESIYACPMKCEGAKTYDKPGKCPVCKMDLQLVSEKLIQVVSPGKQVLSNQATVKLHSGSNGNIMKAQGYIVPAQNRNQSVSVRFGGRIEKLYIKFNNQFVNRGEKIMDIYSPELRTFQEEHLFLFKSNDKNSLIDKSREKLRLLGISENQIAQLEKNDIVELTVSIFSPANGYVLYDSQSPNMSTESKSSAETNPMSMKVSSSIESSYTTSSGQLREGMYVNKGETIFSINDLTEVWALISISNQHINQIQNNQSVKIISESNKSDTIIAKVSLIEQAFEDASQRFSRVRIILPNVNNSLKINSLVKAQFEITDVRDLQVPSSAVYKTGLNAFVWVKTDTTQKGTGIFQVRKVNAGSTNNGMIIITGGLLPNEEIAKEAGLMTDSETFINAK